MMRGLRCDGDTLGTLPDIEEILASEHAVPNGFKMDYSGKVMDPADDDHFFGHSALVEPPTSGPATHWQTWLAKYTIDCEESSNRRSWPNRACYADCDMQAGPGVLDIFDFLCFGNRFAAGDPYACDCDTSTGLGVCDIFDFLCFGNEFNNGCP